jgi:hypothetical protein
MRLAELRNEGRDVKAPKGDRGRRLGEEDTRRGLMQMPDDVFEAQMLQAGPPPEGLNLKGLLAARDLLKVQDPLASLQADPLPDGEAGGQFVTMRMVPNFEMAMYLAQATGSTIVTDARHRFLEILEAMALRGAAPIGGAPQLAQEVGRLPLAFPRSVANVVEFALGGGFEPFWQVTADTSRYLRDLPRRGSKSNYDRQLAARFARARSASDAIVRSGADFTAATVRALVPNRGIQDNTINRLLLMSSSEHHWSDVPMAFYLEPAASADA